MASTYRLFVGVDLGGDEHQVTVVDAEGHVVAERVVQHEGEALAKLSAWLFELAGEPAAMAVAIESPRSVVVEMLVERGFSVFTVNPKQLDRFRDRHTMAGAKDDRRDAFVLATSLRTDESCFHRVRLDDPLVVQLREVSRLYDSLGEELGRLANQLRDQLHRAYAAPLQCCPAADEPWLWALLAQAPTQGQAARLRPVQVTRILRAHRIRRFEPADLVAALRSPTLPVAPGVAEAAAEHIQLLIPRLQLIHEQRSRVGRRIDALLKQLATAEENVPPENRHEHRDVEIVQSLPGVGRIVAAAMLAEASQPLAERDYHAIRAHAGLAPVTRRSGKRSRVSMRRACNQRLRNAFYHCARTATQSDLSSQTYYAKLRARGHSHGRALRSVADRLLRILIAMLKTETLYTQTDAALAP
jgi:transposase